MSRPCLGDHDDPLSSELARLPPFLRTPVIIVRHVLDLLERKDIDAFRLASRTCRYLSEPVTFRKVALNDHTGPKILTHFCDRLANPKDILSESVHHIQIGPFEDETLYPGDEILREILENAKDLRDLTWHVRCAIPAEVLKILHTKQSSSRLHIVNPERNKSRGLYNVYTPPDYPALASPQLHSLDYTVYGYHEQVAHMKWEFYSELPTIKKYLLRARNLKVLRLQISTTYEVPRQNFWTVGPECLSFDVGEEFPAIEKLGIPFESYDLSAKYCQQWSKAMDWSRLRRLDLGRGSPGGLFAALTGKVPNLKTLIFGFFPPGYYSWACPDVEVFKNFSNSIDGLEEIVATNTSANPFDAVRDALISKHGHSLKTLRISYCYNEAIGWGDVDVKRLAQICPGVQDLALKIAYHHRGWQSTEWPDATMAAFQDLKHLRNLEVQFRLDENSREFLWVDSKGNKFPRKEASEERAVAFFKQLLGSGEDTPLESVNVRFQTDHPHLTKEWAFLVTRLPGDGVFFEVEKKFVHTEAIMVPCTPIGTCWDPWG